MACNRTGVGIVDVRFAYVVASGKESDKESNKEITLSVRELKVALQIGRAHV